MLTESERAWLKRRQFCNDFYTVICDRTDYLLHPDLEDALEFSERVAAKLAKAYELLASNCEGYEFDPCSFCRINVVKTLNCMSSCAGTVLKRMRIEVEEEMDAD